MIIAITSTVISLVLFLCLYLGFRTGLRLGMQTSKGQIPQKINPVSTIKAEVKTPAENELLKGYANMMNFTGEPKVGDK